MLGGYIGKIVHVNLSSGRIEEEVVREDLYRDVIGGTGLGVRVLYERMKAGADPLGPDNILGFVTGPLTATPTPGSGRHTVTTKSPITEAWVDSNSGGYWGPELKHAGYDAIFISGASPSPVYLVIVDGKVELRDANHLWGKDTNETEELIQQVMGEKKVRVACIGPGGESCSLMAGIVNDHGRIAARGGVGAVMGSKRLKAIGVKGTGRAVSVAYPERLKAVRESFLKQLKESPFHTSLSASGTGGGTSFLVSIGDCPTKNWNATGTPSMPSCANLDTPMMDKYKVRAYGCHSCTIRCGALIQVNEGPFATKSQVHRPEYETLAGLGTLCLNDRVESVIKANEICNLSGLDTIAVGNVIAFAMECFENGLIRKEDTDGIELVWGNADAVVALTEKIAKREGFGKVLADGVKKAAERIGKGSERFAMHVHGHRIPYHDPRLSPCHGTNYIADAQPACHMEPSGTALLERGVPLGSAPIVQPPQLELYGDYTKKGTLYATGSAYYQVLSSSGLCSLHALYLPIPIPEFLSHVTGWECDWEEVIQTGRRILTMRQAFNAREGLRPNAFRLPERFLEPLKVGVPQGTRIDFDSLKRCYFEAMGWDTETGKPSRDTLSELRLDALVKDL